MVKVSQDMKKFLVVKVGSFHYKFSDAHNAPLGEFKPKGENIYQFFDAQKKLQYTISSRDEGKGRCYSLTHDDKIITSFVSSSSSKELQMPIKESKYGDSLKFIIDDAKTFGSERDGKSTSVFIASNGEIGGQGGELHILKGERRNFTFCVMGLIIYMKEEELQTRKKTTKKNEGSSEAKSSTDSRRKNDNKKSGSKKKSSDDSEKSSSHESTSHKSKSKSHEESSKSSEDKEATASGGSYEEEDESSEEAVGQTPKKRVPKSRSPNSKRIASGSSNSVLNQVIARNRAAKNQ